MNFCFFNDTAPTEIYPLSLHGALPICYESWRGRKIFLPPDVMIVGVEGGEPVEEGLRQFLFFPNGSLFGGGVGISGREGSRAYFVRFDPLTGRVAVLQGNRQ